MSKKVVLKLTASLLAVLAIALIGIPGVFQGFAKFKKGEKLLQYDLEKLPDGSYLARLDSLPQNTVPVFNFSSATYKIDFASLNELSGNVYFRGATLANPYGGSPLKVLEKRTKVNGEKVFTKIAALNEESIFSLNIPNKQKLEPGDLTLILADLSIFNSDCYSRLVKKSQFQKTCPEINLNLPYAVEYFDADNQIEAYIISTDDPVWTALGIYSSPIEILYGQGKAKKNNAQLNKRAKAKVVSLRKGKIGTVGTFTIRPEESKSDLEEGTDDQITIDYAGQRAAAPAPSPTKAPISASPTPYGSSGYTGYSSATGFTGSSGYTGYSGYGTVASPSPSPTGTPVTASPVPTVYPSPSPTGTPTSSPIPTVYPSPSPTGTPWLPTIFTNDDPIIICHYDKNNDGKIEPGFDQSLVKLSTCTARGGRAGAVNTAYKTGGGAVVGTSPHIPAVTGGGVSGIPGIVQGYRPLPIDSKGRPPICGNAAEHLRAWLESQGHKATFTVFACTFEVNLICERFLINKKVLVGQHTFAHAVTDLHKDGKTSYIDPQNGNKEVDMDGNNDGKVTNPELGLHDNLGNDADMNATINPDDDGYDQFKALCDDKKPLRVEAKPIGNCEVESYDSRAAMEKKNGVKTPRTWEEWQKNHGFGE